jgi:hypothetical protein
VYCRPQCGLQRSPIGYLPNKNTKWPTNLILHGHFDRANKIGSFHLNERYTIWLVRYLLFIKHKSERRNTKYFLGFAVTSNKITSQVYGTRHAENSRKHNMQWIVGTACLKLSNVIDQARNDQASYQIDSLSIECKFWKAGRSLLSPPHTRATCWANRLARRLAQQVALVCG